MLKKMAVFASLLSLFMLTTFCRAQDQKHYLMPEITFLKGYPLATVSKIFRNIAQARSDLHENNLTGAKAALERTIINIKFMRETSPASQIRDYIWIARKHLPSEDTERIMKDFIAIEAALRRIEETRFVQDAEEYIDKARESVDKKYRDKADTELKLADKALIHSELNLPMSITEEYVISARDFLGQNLPQQADHDLRNAEDQLQFMAVDLYAPLPYARKGLSNAAKNFANKDYSAAKKDLEQAGHYLKEAAARGDDKTRQEAEKLLKDLAAFKNKLEKTGKTGEIHIKSLWERTRALAERDAEYTILIVKKATTINKTRGDVIDAKLHVLNAETYQLTEGNVKQANREIEAAEKNLSNALSGSDEQTKKQLSEINAELRVLRSESNKQSDAIRSRYRGIQDRLYQLIYKK